MNKLYLTLVIFLTLVSKLYCQDENKKDISIGINLGGYDGYSFFEFRSPLLFVEYNITLKDFLQVGPQLLIGNGSFNKEYISMNLPQIRKSTTNTIDFGLICKIIPFPKKFDNVKIVQGLTYLYEERYLTNTESEPTWNGKYTNRGFNYMLGLDIDFIKIGKFKLGTDFRMNTSANRNLLIYCGVITSVKI